MFQQFLKLTATIRNAFQKMGTNTKIEEFAPLVVEEDLEEEADTEETLADSIQYIRELVDLIRHKASFFTFLGVKVSNGVFRSLVSVIATMIVAALWRTTNMGALL